MLKPSCKHCCRDKMCCSHSCCGDEVVVVGEAEDEKQSELFHRNFVYCFVKLKASVVGVIIEGKVVILGFISVSKEYDCSYF